MRKILLIIVLAITITLCYNFLSTAASSEDPVVSIGDITRIKGIRDNQLMGNGIIIGLAGTGDSNRSQATIQMVANMLTRFGVNVTPEQIQSRNLAAVIVTATLPPFTHKGDRIDVTVNSLGDARSLQGGTLLMTPLNAPNGDIYAVAQGPISIGGFNTKQGGSQLSKNHSTVGRIPEGAIVERELDYELGSDELTLLLNHPYFETAGFIAQAINEDFKYLFLQEPIARAIDAGEVHVSIPEQFRDRIVEFISRINNFEVRTGMEAKVVINERTGTIVMGHNVRISTVSVAHGSLRVEVTTEKDVSQPDPFSKGETIVTKSTKISASEEEGEMVIVPNGGTIDEIVQALNVIGASPGDIITIIQAIKAAGALHARIELI
jgi:flagellar P-ring protein FlgI